MTGNAAFKVVNRGVRRLLICVVLAMTIYSGYGAPTDKKDAQKAVSGWLKLSDQPLKARMAKDIHTVTEHKNDAGQVIFYIVSMKPEGYVVISPDDLIEPVIAFSATGDYDADPRNPLYALLNKDLPQRLSHVKALQAEANRNQLDFAPPPALRKSQSKWKQFVDNVEVTDFVAVDEEPIATASLSTINDVRVGVLVQSRWSQTTEGSQNCYNYYTPGNYYCGCVATALAQILRYHQHPTTGVGTASFSITVDDDGDDGPNPPQSQTASLRGGDGAGGPYDWANMVLDPTSSITLIQRQAIGALTVDCGSTVNMGYASDGSGATTSQTADALRGTFMYGNAIKGYDGYSELVGNGFNDMANPNLDAGLPVIIAITGSSGGHAVVCDGYGFNAATLYHHINMGWAGSSDAWYNLPGDLLPDFEKVHTCVYNIFVSGSGEIISGRVLNGASEPQSGITVTADDSGTLYADITDSKGIYAIRVPSGKSFVLSCPSATSKNVTTGTSADNGAVGNRWGQDFTVTMDQPYIAVTPVSLRASCHIGNDAETQTFSLRNVGVDAVNYSITDNQEWLSVSPTSGISTGEYDTITVSYATSGLALGKHSAEITITDANAGNSPVVIPVSLGVTPDCIYYEDFDLSSDIPANMSQALVVGNVSWAVRTGGNSSKPSSAHSGANNAYFFSMTKGSSMRLISPVFNTASYTNLTLSFWHAQVFWSPDQDTLKVLYSTNGGSTWSALAEYTNNISSWTERVLTLPSSSTNGCVAFEGVANYGYGVCVDDIMVDGDPLGPLAGATITESGGSTDVSEDGLTDTYTLVLTSQPAADVMIAITDDAQVNVSPASLTFTDANWDRPQTVTVSAEDDSDDEGMHTGTITHSATSTDPNYDSISIRSVTVTITDNDTRGNLGFAPSSYSVSEDGTSVRVYVTRTGGSNDVVSVNYATVDGTAVAGTDYETAGGTLNWADGSMITNHFDVSILDNSLYTGDRAFQVRLSNPIGGASLALTNATVTIQEDEVLPSVPDGLVATPSVGRVDLIWVASSEATGYKVKRAVVSGGTYTTVGTPDGTGFSDMTVTNGSTYYYVVSAIGNGGESDDSTEVEVRLLQALPFTETFDGSGMASTTGVLDGQRGWSGGGNTLVQAGDGHGGSNGLGIAEDVAAIDFLNGTNTVTLGFWIKPVAGAEPKLTDLPTNSTAVIWVGTNQHVMVYSNTTVVTLPAQVAADQWCHFEANVDYDGGVWSLAVNGTNAASGLALFSAQSRFAGLEFQNTSATPSYLDDISISGVLATLTDYENWLMGYFSTTSMDGSILSSNGVNTIREAYIIGLDPTDPSGRFSISGIAEQSGATVLGWESVPGRLYNVYWSSNLLGGAASFQLLQSNIPWNANSITDTVHSAEDKGFYRIDVQLE